MVVDDDLLELNKMVMSALDMEKEVETFEYYRDEKVYAKINEIGVHKVLRYWLHSPSSSAAFIFFNFPRIWLNLTKQDFIDFFNDFSKRERFNELFNLMKIIQGYLGLDIYDFIEENEIFRGKTLDKFYEVRDGMEDQFRVRGFLEVSDEMIEDLKILRNKYITESIFKIKIEPILNTSNTIVKPSILKQLSNHFKKLIDF